MAASLTGADRRWLRAFADTIYANPFEATAESLRGRLPGVDPTGPLAPGHPYGLIRGVLDTRLAEMASRGVGGLGDLDEGEDRTLARHAWLFEIYDGLVDRFDAHVREQEASPERAVRVEFAADALRAFAERGFDDDEAARYLGLFFQLRRAFHFIERNLAGESEGMRRLRARLWESLFASDARTYDRHLWNRMDDFSTLLLGETGTGKGSAAAAIGRAAYIPFDASTGRFAVSFVDGFLAANLSEFPEALVESELFGHRKGSFTGAVADHDGVFARCSPHGALFLDEIGEVSVPVQVKLLRVLQDREFTPVGSRDRRRFAGRLIAATNRPGDGLRGARGLREDFYYRLSSLVIELPPLRERIAQHPEEIEILALSLLDRLAGDRDAALTDRVLGALREPALRGYEWPGNVRELEQAIRRILLTGAYAPEPSPSAPVDDALVGDEPEVRVLLARYCARLYRRHGTYEEVARRTGLDRRTVRKYVLEHDD